MTDPIADVIERCAALPRALITALFARYGRPLDDPHVELDPVVTLEGGARLGRLSHRAPVDVIANDHFVLAHGDETLAMPGPLFAAAVAALSRKS